MPQYNSNVLPATPGLSLGSQSQPWDIFIRTAYIGQQVVVGSTPVTIAYASPMTIAAGGATVVNIGPLTGNVNSSTFTSGIASGSTQFLLMRIIQDGTGGRKFTWPLNFYGAAPIDNVILTMNGSQVLSQMFLYIKDSDSAYALAPAVLYP